MLDSDDKTYWDNIGFMLRGISLDLNQRLSWIPALIDELALQFHME